MDNNLILNDGHSASVSRNPWNRLYRATGFAPCKGVGEDMKCVAWGCANEI